MCYVIEITKLAEGLSLSLSTSAAMSLPTQTAHMQRNSRNSATKAVDQMEVLMCGILEHTSPPQPARCHALACECERLGSVCDYVNIAHSEGRRVSIFIARLTAVTGLDLLPFCSRCLKTAPARCHV